ncbi:unnamed protein product [Paramecium octaurelia]|uniref:Uncharacterized protein n=1 Tax=Paramecium octaurelia TaxID=43137 RepID=A0A8S1UTF4_PAROT|nr:unnamed protein product [Paramecium octaurelia]
MRTVNAMGTTNSYWGVRALNIYLARCCNGCDQCLGPLKTDCTVCSEGWVRYDNQRINCIHQAPFFLLSKILINQITDPNSDDRIPMEINLLEVNQNIATYGTFTYSINNNLQILTIQVYTKCFTNKKCKVFLQNAYDASLK